MTNQKAKNLIKGVTAAPGLAQGPLFIWKVVELVLPTPYHCDQPEQAWRQIQQAIDTVKQDLITTRDRVVVDVGLDEAEIFDAQLMMVEDIELLETVRTALQQGINPEKAWYDSIEQFACQLESLSDELIKARAADVRDVGRQVLARLLGVDEKEPTLIKSAVVVAQDLSPSQTARLDTSRVLAFCTVEGGPTSHTAILAKALGIPAMVAMGAELLNLQPGQLVLVDGEHGILVSDPTPEEIRGFTIRQQQAAAQFKNDLGRAHEPAVSKDGVTFDVYANIGNDQDAALAIANGAEGVGLFRTEFMFLNRKTMPTIEEQVQTYQQVIHAMQGQPMVVRTLDIGGDKTVEYLGIRKEPNPFLGWRAIRMINERPDILEDQLIALLLAGEGIDLRIMIPMVSQVSEVVLARTILQKAFDRVKADHPAYQVKLQFGIMIEVPSAALMVENFAPYVDFYSIGTNDLTQYTLAVDRMNARVAHLASPFNPAVLKLIERTVRMAHMYGKWVGMCGEFAGDPLAVPFLIGIGLDEFSMSATAIPGVKRMICRWSSVDCKQMVKEVLQLDSAEAVQEFLQKQTRSLPD